MAKTFLISTIIACISVASGVWFLTTWIDVGFKPVPSQTQPLSATANSLDYTAFQSETPIESRFEDSQNTPTPNSEVAIDETVSKPHLDRGLFLDIQQDYVTLRAEDQPLKTVLEELARKSGIQINTQLIADRPLTLQLDRFPIDRALHAILDSEDSFFAFESQGKRPAALKVVWVLPAGTGGNWVPNTAACSQDLAELERQLTAQEPAQRAEAIEAWIDLQGPEAAQAVVQSLGDHDDDVRYRALSKAHVSDLILPPEVLAELFQHDRSALVRMMAIEAIGNHPSIEEQDKKTFARLGIDDSDAAVQTRASEVLSHLETAPLILEQEQAFYSEQENFLVLPEENFTEGD